MAVLPANKLRHDFDQPGAPGSDHLVFSPGRRVATAVLAVRGRGRGHRRGAVDVPQARGPATRPSHAGPALGDVATASRGQGVPCAVGIAPSGKRLERLGYRTRVLCGGRREVPRMQGRWAATAGQWRSSRARSRARAWPRCRTATGSTANRLPIPTRRSASWAGLRDLPVTPIAPPTPPNAAPYGFPTARAGADGWGARVATRRGVR